MGISVFNELFYFTVNSDVPVASPAFSCLQKFEKLNSKKSNSFTIFGKERYDENNTGKMKPAVN
jgi:hypothetical protein